VVLRFLLHKGQELDGPLVESAAATKPTGASWLVVESATDAMTAARAATDRMIDLLIDRWGFEPVQAYLLCSVAMKLQVSQVVNEPMITVSAAMEKSVLPGRKLFRV
jgi:acetamidase/formamidase